MKRPLVVSVYSISYIEQELDAIERDSMNQLQENPVTQLLMHNKYIYEDNVDYSNIEYVTLNTSII